MAQTIQLRRGTAAEWSSVNPVLAEGEVGAVVNEGRFKIGDGVTAWNDLSYPSMNPVADLTTYQEGPEPAAPDEGNLHFFAGSSAGKLIPSFRGSFGRASALQPALFDHSIYLAVPGSGNSMNVLGGPTVTSSVAMTTPNVGASSIRTQTYRHQVLSFTGGHQSIEVRTSFLRNWRGDQPGLGGFLFKIRFAIVSAVAGQRISVGLKSTTGGNAQAQDPAQLQQWVGLGNSWGDANLQIISNDGSVNASKTDLGSNFPSQGVEDIYDFTLFAPPNAAYIDWEVRRLGLGVSESGRLNSQLPASTNFMAPHIYMNNAGTGSAVQFDLMGFYLESGS